MLANGMPIEDIPGKSLADKAPGSDTPVYLAAAGPARGTRRQPAGAAAFSPRCIDRRARADVNSLTVGAVAQLGERCNRTAEVVSSNLISSTSHF